MCVVLWCKWWFFIYVFVVDVVVVNVSVFIIYYYEFVVVVEVELEMVDEFGVCGKWFGQYVVFNEVLYIVVGQCVVVDVIEEKVYLYFGMCVFEQQFGQVVVECVVMYDEELYDQYVLCLCNCCKDGIEGFCVVDEQMYVIVCQVWCVGQVW